MTTILEVSAVAGLLVVAYGLGVRTGLRRRPRLALSAHQRRAENNRAAASPRLSVAEYSRPQSRDILDKKWTRESKE